MTILMIDIGGSNVKMMVSGEEEMRKFPSGRELTAQQMVDGVKAATSDWSFDAITLGFPGLVTDGKLVREPLNLSGGWLHFDFAKAFNMPVRIINDASLQALANYEGGRMLFVGFGTSVGASLIADDVIVPVELGLIPFSRRHTFMSRLTKEARRQNGQERWQKDVNTAVALAPRHFLAGRYGDRRGKCEVSGSAAGEMPAHHQSGGDQRRHPAVGRRGLACRALRDDLANPAPGSTSQDSVRCTLCRQEIHGTNGNTRPQRGAEAKLSPQ